MSQNIEILYSQVYSNHVRWHLLSIDYEEPGTNL